MLSESSTKQLEYAAIASSAISECKLQPKQAVVNTNPPREKEKDTSDQDAGSNNQSNTMDLDDVNIVRPDKREPTNTETSIDANESQPKKKRKTETNTDANGKDEISNNQSDKMDDVMIVEKGKGEHVNAESEPRQEKRKKIPKKAGSGAKPKESTTANDDKASEVSTHVSTPNKKRKKPANSAKPAKPAKPAKGTKSTKSTKKTQRARPPISKTVEVKIARIVSDLLKGYSNSPGFKGGLKEGVEKVIYDEVKSQQHAQSKESKETEAKLRLKFKAATNEGIDLKSTIKLLTVRNDSERRLSDDSAKKITQLQNLIANLKEEVEAANEKVEAAKEKVEAAKEEASTLIAQRDELLNQGHPRQPAPAEKGKDAEEAEYVASDSEAEDAEKGSDVSDSDSDSDSDEC